MPWHYRFDGDSAVRAASGHDSKSQNSCIDRRIKNDWHDPVARFAHLATVGNDHDLSWYGTLFMLAACFGVLFATFLAG